MSRVPRLLPIVAIAIGGVLAVNAIAGANNLPSLLGGARAFAEEVAAKSPKPKKEENAKTEPLKLAAGPLPPRTPIAAPGAAPSTVCLPTDASIAKEAGLTPEQMRLLESLQARRGQLDSREKSMEMQLTLLSAAEAKLDARIATLSRLKGDIQSLLGQADEKQKAETTRMVGVYTTMAQSKPKEAAKQLTILEDSVRLPIAAGLSNRTLATILSNMTPQDAKKLNEALAHRFESQKLDAGRQAVSAAPAAPALPAPQLAAAQPPKPAAGKPVAAEVTDAATAPVKTAAAAPKPRRPVPKPAAKKPDPADDAAPMQTAPTAPPPTAPAAPAPAPAEKAAAG